MTLRSLWPFSISALIKKFLFRDEFTTDIGSSTNRLTTPGPGWLTIVRNDGDFYIADGKLTIVHQSTPVWGDLEAYIYDGVTRSPGLIMSFDLEYTNPFRSTIALATSRTATQDSGVNTAIGIYNNARDQYVVLNNTQFRDDDITELITYSYRFIARSSGGFVIRGNKLLQIGNAGNQATLYPRISSYSLDGKIDNLRVWQLPAPWDTDFGIATTRLAGARSSGDAFTHEADCIIEWITTTVLAHPNTQAIRFRVQDATNYWSFQWHSGATALYEFVNGVPTTRGSTSSAVANGTRFVIVADNTTIKVYQNNTLIITYASASNFKTNTNGTISFPVGTLISDLISWPRTISGAALTALQATPASYLFNDEFTTNINLGERQCEPGPGALRTTQLDGTLSIANGKLVFPGQDTPTINEQGFYSNVPLTRSAGLVLVMQARFSNVASIIFTMIGWNRANHSPSGLDASIFVTGGTLGYSISNTVGLGPSNIGTVANATDYIFAVVLRSTGAFAFIKGGTYSEWTLIWLSEAQNTSLVRPSCDNYDGELTSEYVRAYQLPAPWTTDYGIATQRLAGSRSEGDTFSHEANCIIEWTITTRAASSTTNIQFRKQDNLNLWVIQCTANGEFSLSEYVDGVLTARATAGYNTVNSGSRVVIIADGSVIKGYVNNSLIWTYSNAVNFQTATNGVVSAVGPGGVISDVISWPRTLSGAPLSALTATPDTYLLRDEFTTDGPVVPRTAEPGPGKWNVYDSGGNLIIKDGKLYFTGRVAFFDPKVWTDPFTVATGLMYIARITQTTLASFVFGFASGAPISIATSMLYDRMFYFTGGQAWHDAGSIQGGSISQGIEYKCAVVLRPNGGFMLIKGGTYTQWTLLWTGTRNTAQTLTLQLSRYSGSTEQVIVDNDYLAQLGWPWNDEYALATTRLAGARQSWDTFTHESNCIIEYVVTALSIDTANIRLHFRYQDANNFWAVDVASTGWIGLFEFVNNVPTLRGSVSGIVSVGHRIVIIADGAVIKVYSNNTLRIAYSSAINFQNLTTGIVWLGTNGGVSDIIAWPRTLSGPALAQLEKYSS